LLAWCAHRASKSAKGSAGRAWRPTSLVAARNAEVVTVVIKAAFAFGCSGGSTDTTCQVARVATREAVVISRFEAAVRVRLHAVIATTNLGQVSALRFADAVLAGFAPGAGRLALSVPLARLARTTGARLLLARAA
jgi:hypothetical protein